MTHENKRIGVVVIGEVAFTSLNVDVHATDLLVA